MRGAFKAKVRLGMFNFAKALYEAFGIESPKLFIIGFALFGAVLFGLFGWVLDRGYRNGLRERSRAEPTSVQRLHDPRR
jgi:hypothetical protein